MLSCVLYIRNSNIIFCSKLPLFTNFITFTYMQLPEAPTFGWHDELLMASDMSSFCLLYHICMHDVSCLTLPPSGGVMSRWWLLILTSEMSNRLCLYSCPNIKSYHESILIFEPSVLATHMKLKNNFVLQVNSSVLKVIPFRKFYHICMHDVSCLKLPPSGGVMSRWWLLILTSEFIFVCSHYLW